MPCAARTSLRSIRTRPRSTSPRASVVALPEDVPPHRAVLAANMETALNGVWDAAPGPADRIAVVGAGVVGSLVAYLCGRIAGADVTLVDINSSRAELAAEARGWFRRARKRESAIAISSFMPAARPTDCGTALELAGDEATVLEMSWYGDAAVTAMLGGPFHSRRLRLVSSQVGSIAPSHRPRWTHGRRLAAAVALLADPRLDALLAPADCVQRFAGATAGNSRRWKRNTLPTHHLLVRSCLVHRRSSRPHHDRSFFPGRGFRTRAGRCMARPSWSMPPSSPRPSTPMES